MSKKLYVICGHGNGDSGSVGGGKTEADLVRKLAKMMAAANPDVVVLDTSRNWYADQGVNAALKKKVGSNPVIELHMDCAAASARGGHVEIDSDLKADAYDKALGNYIAKQFPGRADKIRKVPKLGNLNRAQAAGINYRLLEVCFISNKADRKKLCDNMASIAKGIAGCFDLGAAKPAVKPAAKPKAVKYKIAAKSGVNIRKKADVKSAKVGAYAKGDVVTVSETKTVSGNLWGKTSKGWFAIKYGGASYAKKC